MPRRKNPSRVPTPTSFKPGQSGNPGGRKKLTPDAAERLAAARALAAENAEEAIRVAVEIMLNPAEESRVRLDAARADGAPVRLRDDVADVLGVEKRGPGALADAIDDVVRDSQAPVGVRWRASHRTGSSCARDNSHWNIARERGRGGGGASVVPIPTDDDNVRPETVVGGGKAQGGHRQGLGNPQGGIFTKMNVQGPQIGGRTLSHWQHMD